MSQPPAPGPSADATSSPDPFKSKLSAHNVKRSPASTPAPAPAPIPTLTFNNSLHGGSEAAVRALSEGVVRLDLEPTEGARPANKNARKKDPPHKQRAKLQITPPQLPQVDDNVKYLQELFTKNIAPLYSSSPQYLDNLSHHPFMFGFQQDSTSAQQTSPHPHQNSPHPQQTQHKTRIRQPPTPTAHQQSHKQQRPEKTPQKNQQRTKHAREHVNNFIASTSDGNGVPQSPRYFQNLMQHPLLRQSIPVPQPTVGNVSTDSRTEQPTLDKTGRRRKRSKKKSQKMPTELNLFEDYLSIEEIEEGLKNGNLIEGSLRINPKQYQRAYVSGKDRNEQDIFVDGIKNRNRALEGDIVVVQLISAEEESIDGDNTDEPILVDVVEKTLENNVEITDEDKENGIVEGKIQRRGKVVYIREKVHQRKCIGNLKLMADKNRQKALFCPRDFRVPRLNIPFTSWPDNFYKDAKSYENVLFLAQIVDWRDTRYAIGTILQNVGQVGDIQTEMKAILAENDLDVTPYGPEVRDLFPPLDFIIPEEEILLREDLRKLCIFSIDPFNCRDVDDAVSCKPLQNGNFEIGVHISDVSYYLKEKTILDEKVADRATTIYLVEKAYHMLPDDLCMLCSLFAGVDKLAFSVFWEITPEAKVLSHRFTKSVIHSCAQLAYEHAQAILEDRDLENFPETYNGFKQDDIKKTVKVLGQISAIFRRNRFNNGALKIDQPKVSFKLDPANGLPLSFTIYESQESHQLIEEFMLLANMTVAERIHNDHPRLAFLRCHPPPSKYMLEELDKSLKPMGINLDISSAGNLYSSLLPHIGPDCENSQKAIVLSMLCTKPMTRAKYFCADGWEDDEFGHYALNVPLYTHFTSPIRRYADIMVHRLLAASLNYTDQPDWKVDRVRWIAANCNKQKYNAKKAGESSTELYTLKYIQLHSPVLTEAVVVDVREKFFDVIIVAMGLNRRIYMNNGMPDYKCIKNDAGSKLSKLVLTWPKTDDLPEVLQTVEVFSVLQVQMVRGEEMVKVETKLVRPS